MRNNQSLAKVSNSSIFRLLFSSFWSSFAANKLYNNQKINKLKTPVTGNIRNNLKIGKTLLYLRAVNAAEESTAAADGSECKS